MWGALRGSSLAFCHLHGPPLAQPLPRTCRPLTCGSFASEEARRPVRGRGGLSPGSRGTCSSLQLPLPAHVPVITGERGAERAVRQAGLPERHGVSGPFSPCSARVFITARSSPCVLTCTPWTASQGKPHLTPSSSPSPPSPWADSLGMSTYSVWTVYI